MARIDTARDNYSLPLPGAPGLPRAGCGAPAQQAGSGCSCSRRLTAGCVWGCSRRPECAPLVQAPAVGSWGPPQAGSSGGTLQKQSLWAQRGKMLLLDLCILQGEIHRAGSRHAEEGRIPAGRDMYENRSLTISLSFLFSTRRSQR